MYAHVFLLREYHTDDFRVRPVIDSFFSFNLDEVNKYTADMQDVKDTHEVLGESFDDLYEEYLSEDARKYINDVSGAIQGIRLRNRFSEPNMFSGLFNIRFEEELDSDTVQAIIDSKTDVEELKQFLRDARFDNTEDNSPLVNANKKKLDF